MNDRSSIKRIDLGYNRKMTSFRVFPPFLEPLRETALGKACIGRDIVTSYERLEALSAAIAAASDEELDLARPVLLFQMAELEDFLRDTAFEVDFKLDIRNSAAAVADKVLEGVSSDTLKALTKISGSPKNKKTPVFIKESMAYLAELLVVASAASVTSPEFADVKERASATYVRLSQDARKIADSIGGAYEGVAAGMGDHARILRDTDMSVREMDMSIPRLSSDAIGRLTIMLGNRDRLWAIQNEKQMAKAIEDGTYSKLTGLEAGNVRKGLVFLFGEINRCFNTGGFVAEMLMTAAALEYRATKGILQADGHTERKVMLGKKIGYESDKDYRQRIAKRVVEVPEDRFVMRSNASETMRKSKLIADFMTEVRSELHPETATGRMHFRRLKDEMIVGTVPGWTDAFVVFRDRLAGTADTTFIARVPLEDATEDLTPIAAKEYFGTNFHSLDDALHHLSSDFASKFFYGGRSISGHDGFDLISLERKAIRQELREGADIRDFLEYDGSTALGAS